MVYIFSILHTLRYLRIYCIFIDMTKLSFPKFSQFQIEMDRRKASFGLNKQINKKHMKY